MSNRDRAKQIIDTLPDYKIDKILLILQGIQIDDEIEDDMFCERLVQSYLNDTSLDKHETVTLDELAQDLGIEV